MRPPRSRVGREEEAVLCRPLPSGQGSSGRDVQTVHSYLRRWP